MEEKDYQAPAVVYEGDLEVQAGSPFTGGGPEEPNPLDLGNSIE
jgi:hypothetical protein